MNILVIDAQGGGIGKAIVSSLKVAFPDAEITAVGVQPYQIDSLVQAAIEEIKVLISN